MKDLLIERMQESDEEQLAHKLGISYDELAQLNHRVDTDQSNDGLIYNYIISFDPDSPKEILSKINKIDQNNKVWLTPWEFEGDYYYEEQYRAIISNKHFYESFLEAMSSAEKLNEIDIDGGHLTLVLKRQIYVSIMAALEAFLSETFINLTSDHEGFFRNFIETFPDFKERKIELSRIFAEQEIIKETAKKVMIEVIYHNLGKVSKMYTSTFKMEFPDIADLSKCVSIRHDLVHRNGKTAKGEFVNVNKAMIADLIKTVSGFVKEIANKLQLPGH